MMNEKPTLRAEVDIGSYTAHLDIAGSPSDIATCALIILRDVYDTIADMWSEAAAEEARNQIADIVNDDEFWTVSSGEKAYDVTEKQ